MRLAPAASLGLPELTDLFNAAYSDYPVPFRLDLAALQFTLDVTDVDLGASCVAFDDGKPAALALVAVRGAECWIAGMGTAPLSRRKGLGEVALRAALDAARERGAGAALLEVIEENVGALRLYEKLGFEPVRPLVVWMLDGPAGRSGQARPADPVVAQAWIAAHRPSPEPWQRSDATVERMRQVGHTLEGLIHDRGGEIAGAALCRVSSERVSVLQIAARDEDAAADLIAAASSRAGTLRLINAPAGEPASRALERLGGRAEVRQHEMRLDLDHASGRGCSDPV